MQNGLQWLTFKDDKHGGSSTVFKVDYNILTWHTIKHTHYKDSVWPDNGLHWMYTLNAAQQDVFDVDSEVWPLNTEDDVDNRQWAHYKHHWACVSMVWERLAGFLKKILKVRKY